MYGSDLQFTHSCSNFSRWPHKIQELSRAGVLAPKRRMRYMAGSSSEVELSRCGGFSDEHGTFVHLVDFEETIP